MSDFPIETPDPWKLTHNYIMQNTAWFMPEEQRNRKHEDKCYWKTKKKVQFQE